MTLALMLRKQGVDGVEGVVGGVHEDAALQIDHRVVDAAVRGAFEDAVAGQAGLQIGRAQHAARPLLAVGRDGVQVVDQLALVPDVVAGGEHIRAQVEEVVGNLRRHAKAAGGVFGIDDDQVHVVGLDARARCARARSCVPRCRRCRRQKECSRTAPSF